MRLGFKAFLHQSDCGAAMLRHCRLPSGKLFEDDAPDLFANLIISEIQRREETQSPDC